MFPVLMTDWSLYLWYKSENKATFFFQNRNTWLISVEIWASVSLSAILMNLTKILNAKFRHKGCFKTRLIFTGKGSLLVFRTSLRGARFGGRSNVAPLEKKEGSEEGIVDALPSQVPLCFWSRNTPDKQAVSAILNKAGSAHWTSGSLPSQGSEHPPTRPFKGRSTSHLVSTAVARMMGFHKPDRKGLELSSITKSTSNQHSLRLWFQKPMKWNV